MPLTSSGARLLTRKLMMGLINDVSSCLKAPCDGGFHVPKIRGVSMAVETFTWFPSPAAVIAFKRFLMAGRINWAVELVGLTSFPTATYRNLTLP